MNRNFLAVKKEFTTKAKCKSLIKTLDKNLKVDKSNPNLNYYYKDIKLKSIQKFIVDRAVNFVKLYAGVYPEINMTSDKWAMTELRFKNLNQVNLLTNGIPNTVINIQAECWLFNYI